jgi:glycerate 2-kinase
MHPTYEQHRDHVQGLVEAALRAADPYHAVSRHLSLKGSGLQFAKYYVELGDGRLFLVAAGKAAVAMTAAAAEALGDRIYRGLAVAKQPARLRDGEPGMAHLPGNIALAYGSHPVPDERSIQATSAVLEMLAETREGDLVLCLISGGASALFTRPRIPLDEWQGLTDALLASGCTIDELNAVRRPLDQVKGGGLARAAAPAGCVSLILSDVVGNHLEAIGSGPTVPGSADPAAARQVLERYDIAGALPAAAWRRLLPALEAAGQPERHPEPLNLIIGDVRQAAEAAISAGRALGFEAALLTVHLEGEAREVGRVAAALARDATSGSCLVLGGETTVTVTGQGKGGRNQELALAAAITLAEQERVVVASFATDGEDGPTGAAGAIATGETAARAAELGLDLGDYLDRNDSYRLFSRLGDLIVTGPTGTNVNDLVIMLRYA